MTATTSPSWLESTTGNESGNRTAQRTSCRVEAVRERTDGCGKGESGTFIRVSPDPFRVIITLPEFSHKSYGTKVFRKVTICKTVVLPAARLAMTKLCAGLTVLSREGLDIGHGAVNSMAGVLFDSLDLADLKYAL